MAQFRAGAERYGEATTKDRRTKTPTDQIDGGRPNQPTAMVSSNSNTGLITVPRIEKLDM